MGDKSSRRIVVPVVLGLLMAAALGIGLRYDLGTAREPTPTVSGEEAPREIWRCHACARIRGKSWTPCKTVTGRGTKKAAEDLVNVRVCSEATNPETDCRITKMDCRQLSEADIAPIKGSKIRFD
jgi:hypothetical protein